MATRKLLTATILFDPVTDDPVLNAVMRVSWQDGAQVGTSDRVYTLTAEDLTLEEQTRLKAIRSTIEQKLVQRDPLT